MYFVDSAHKNFYEEHKADNYGRDVLAAIYLLGSMDITRDTDIIDYEKVEFIEPDTSVWSSGEAMIVDIAHHLFTGQGEVDIYYTIKNLDLSRRHALIQAISILGFGE